jgi:hypothetical protein
VSQKYKYRIIQKDTTVGNSQFELTVNIDNMEVQRLHVESAVVVTDKALSPKSLKEARKFFYVRRMPFL